MTIHILKGFKTIKNGYEQQNVIEKIKNKIVKSSFNYDFQNHTRILSTKPLHILHIMKKNKIKEISK